GCERQSGGAQALEFAAKPDALRTDRVIKRLLPVTVARQQNASFNPVPDAKSEHATQPVNALHARFLVKVQDALGVGLCFEPVAPPEKPFAKLTILVDFAVEDNPDGVV